MEYIQRLSWADDIEDDDPLNLALEDNNPPINKLFLDKPKLDEDLLYFFGLTQEDIDKDPSKDIRVFDSFLYEDNIIFLIHYTRQQPHRCVEGIRGTIVKRTRVPPFEHTVICRSFPFTPEESLKTLMIKDKYFENKIIEILPAHEGTILRVWWNDSENMWFMSTHRKLDARLSKWGGGLFGDLFYQLFPIEELEKKLVKTKCYIFLLCHPENRLVIPYQNGILYHTATFDQQTEGMILGHKLSEEEKIDFPTVKYSESLKNLKKWNDFKTYVEGMNWTDVGVMIFINSLGIPIKVLNSEYITKKNLRGNESNLRIRWFQCQNEGKEKELEELLPEKSQFWDTLKSDISKLPSYLLDCDKKRKTQLRTTRLQKELYWILETYTKEMKHKKDHESSECIMKKVFNRYNPRVKNALIRNMHNEEKRLLWITKNEKITL